MVKILVIEDDDHKVRDIKQLISENYPELCCDVVTSVREGFIRVEQSSAELLILDMALPTFDTGAGSGGGVDQPQGGLEIIRLIDRIRKPIKIIILTQYPDVEIEGEFFPLESVASSLSKNYKCEVIGAILYKYQNDEWKRSLLDVLGRYYANFDD